MWADLLEELLAEVGWVLFCWTCTLDTLLTLEEGVVTAGGVEE
jgi:hypothetical protein